MSIKAVIYVFLMSCVMFSCTTRSHDNVQKVEHTLNVSSGTVDRYYVHSGDLECRYIDVWFPEDYSADKKYAVVYMHDGQMLFDVGNTWNLKEWKVDEAMTAISQSSDVRDAIVVGIYNNVQKRHNEDIPSAFLQYMSKNIPSSEGHKFYYDHGTVGLDSNYGTHQEKVDLLMEQSGYTSENFCSKVFEGEDHNEDYWANRLNIPLTFLLKE